MGAHFTSLLKQTPTLFNHLTRVVQANPVVAWFRGFSLPWPPEAATVQRCAPYIFGGVYVPKLAWDLWTLFKKAPIDDEMQAECDAELDVALAKCHELLQAFVTADIEVPEGTRAAELKSHIIRCTRTIFEVYGCQPPVHAASNADSVSYTHLTLPTIYSV